MGQKDELMHHGVAGQKWGVRRFQNADGSLTNKGKLRYDVGKNSNKLTKVENYVAQQKQLKESQQKQRIMDAVAKTKATKVPVFNDGPSKTSGGGGGSALEKKAKYVEYSKDDPDFQFLDKLTEKGDFEQYRLGDTEFFGFKGANGNYVIIEEDMKWELPEGVTLDGATEILDEFGKRVQEARKNGDYSHVDWKKWADEAVDKIVNKKKSSGELMHYGILGMHWGIRRYQNENGHLTAAGKKRYKNEPSPDHYVLPDSKQPYQLSNQELKDRIARIELENKYTRLEEDMATPARKSFDKYKAITIAAVSALAIDLGKNAIKKAIENKGTKVLTQKAIDKAVKARSQQILIEKLATKAAEKALGG